MKAKKIIIILAFALFVLGLKAQDKYEYASVVYTAFSTKKGYIFISQENKYQKTDVELEEGAIAENLTPVLSVINKMSNEGWEVYSNNILGGGGIGVHIYYYLRKKKN